MKIVILGCNGGLGRSFQDKLAGQGGVTALDRSKGDILDHEAIAKTLTALAPDVIINCAAYTAVDLAETEKDKAFAANADAVAHLASVAKDLGALLVHYSTDYVFDGSGDTPWREDDPVGPLNVYGASKLAGDEAVMRSGCRHLILRVSWVYGEHGNNFIKAILAKAQTTDKLSVVADQIGAPTHVGFIASQTLDLIPRVLEDASLQGLYHCVPAGETSWCDYARFLLAEKGLGHVQVDPVGSDAYPRPAKRPLNSRLSTERLRAGFGIDLPDWKDDVRAYVRALS